MSPYQGWPNYETWSAYTWLTSVDAKVAQTTDDMVFASMRDNSFESAVGELSEKLKEYVEDRNPLAEDATLYSQLLQSAIDGIQFVYLAQSLLHDAWDSNPQTKPGYDWDEDR